MIGNVLVFVALACSLASMVLYYLSFKGKSELLNYARLSYHFMAMLVISASAFLWYIILTHQYQYHYVYSYSTNALNTGFLISSFWGGQEGSFMLWLLLTAIVGIILQSYTQKRDSLEPRIMMVFTLATSFLLIMVSYFFKNPFAYIWAESAFVSTKDINPSILNLPLIQNFLFSDQQNSTSMVKVSNELISALKAQNISVSSLVVNGKGLNPQLLNFWMQIHPPVLFAGFAMCLVPFTFAISALLKNDYRDWVSQAFPWTLAAAGVLGLGIMMGGYWAYEMLGWGGYWAWDPVENSSLVPWLIAVASIHTLLVQKKSQNKSENGKFVKTNIILALLIYILILYSTFLTRSGVLGDASVHSFVDPGKLIYAFLLLFIGSFIFLGIGLTAYRWKSLSALTKYDEGLLSRELALFTGAVTLGASALIILLGTSAPLISKMLPNAIQVDTSFYNEMNIPIAIIIGLINGLSLLLKWKNTKRENLNKQLFIHLGITFFISVLIAIFGQVTNVMLLVLIFASVFAISVNAEVLFKILKGNKAMVGAYVAHIGISLFIVGVVASAGFTKEKDLNLALNKPQEALGYKMTFVNIEPFENNTKYKFLIDIEKDSKKYRVAPVMYIAEFNQSLMREPAILSLASKDIYISPMGYDEPTANNGKAITISKGQSVDVNGTKLTFAEFDFSPDAMKAMQENKTAEIKSKMIAEINGKKISFDLTAVIGKGEPELGSYTVNETNQTFQLSKLSPNGQVEIIVSNKNETPKISQPVLTIQASVKPFISLVWIGVVVMVLGFTISTLRRLKDARLVSEKE